jgi:NADPH:quinone reductase
VGPAGGQVIGGGPGADPGTEIRAAARPVLAAQFAAGKLHVPIAARFPLAEAQQAYDLLASGHAGGKVILLP